MADHRATARESVARHAQWLDVFRDQVGRAAAGLGAREPLGDKENLANARLRDADAPGKRKGAAGEAGQKISLGDGRSLVIRIEQEGL